jgi:nickel-type superoxide dismutase maturation protease
MLLLSRFKISGHSMEPFIKNGQTVLVSSIPYLFSKPKISDIIAFKKTGKVFIKRIAKVKENKYFLKGDNEKDSLDSREFGWIEKGDILGKFIYKIKNP